MLDHEAEWRRHCKMENLTVRMTGSYEAHYWEWLRSSHPSAYTSFNQFQNLKATAHFMTRHDLWDSWHNLMGKYCDFLNPQLERDPWVAGLHNLVVSLNGVGHLEKQTMATVFEELSLALVPTSINPQDGRRKVRWVQENGKRANCQILATSMEDSVVYEVQKNAIPIAESSPAEQPKRRRTGSKKKGAVSLQAAAPTEVEMLALRNDDGSTKNWLQDVIAALHHATAGASESQAQKIFRSLLSICVEFAFFSEVTFNGKTWKNWSTLRGELQTMGKRAASSAGNGAPNVDLSDLLLAEVCTGNAGASNEPSSNSTDEDAKIQENADGLSKSMHEKVGQATAFLSEGNNRKDVDTFIRLNLMLDIPYAMQPGYSALQFGVWKACSIIAAAHSNKIKLSDLLKLVGKECLNTVPTPWVGCAKTILGVVCETCKVPTLNDLNELFPEVSQAIKLSTVRAAYACTMLTILLDSKRVPVTVVKDSGEAFAPPAPLTLDIDPVIKKVAEVDHQIQAVEKWVEVWAALLERLIALPASRGIEDRARHANHKQTKSVTRKLGSTPHPLSPLFCCGFASPMHARLAQDMLRTIDSVADTYFPKLQPVKMEAASGPDAPVATSVLSSDGYMTLYDIYSYGLGDTEPKLTTIALHRMAKQIELILWRTAQEALGTHSTSRAISVNIKAGATHPTFKLAPVSKDAADQEEPDVRLFFPGAVSLNRTAGSYKVASCLGHDFWVSGAGLGSISNDVFQVAWAAKTVKEPDATFQLDFLRAEHLLEASADMKIHVRIALPFLKPKTTAQGGGVDITWHNDHTLILKKVTDKMNPAAGPAGLAAESAAERQPSMLGSRRANSKAEAVAHLLR